MAPRLILAALALACLGAASEPDCGELLKPLANSTSVLGKWISYAVTSDNEGSLALLKAYTSSWFHVKRVFDSTPEPTVFVNKVDGKCIYAEANMTTVGDRTFMQYTIQNQTQVQNVQYLESCPDCLLWTDNVKSNGSVIARHLFIYTRTGNLSLPHLEEFKQQAACLNFTLGLQMSMDGGNLDLCPEKEEQKEEDD